MSVEAEIKAAWTGTEKQLLDLGAVYEKTVRQSDLYFQHPCRDFRQTDEALRIRVEDGKYFITYKGPKLDETTKTRNEYEYPIDGEFGKILESLGFTPSGKVEKSRKEYLLENIIICIDEVKGLGTYIELESDNMDNREKLFKTIEKLGIDRSKTIRKSYLQLLEEKH